MGDALPKNSQGLIRLMDAIFNGTNSDFMEIPGAGRVGGDGRAIAADRFDHAQAEGIRNIANAVIFHAEPSESWTPAVHTMLELLDNAAKSPTPDIYLETLQKHVGEAAKTHDRLGPTLPRTSEGYMQLVSAALNGLENDGRVYMDIPGFERPIHVGGPPVESISAEEAQMLVDIAGEIERPHSDKMKEVVMQLQEAASPETSARRRDDILRSVKEETKDAFTSPQALAQPQHGAQQPGTAMDSWAREEMDHQEYAQQAAQAQETLAYQEGMQEPSSRAPQGKGAEKAASAGRG